MKISLDGGKTFQECEEVRVIWEDLEGSSADEPQVELHLIATNEGLISDIYSSNKGTNQGTSSETAQEIVDKIIN